MSADRQHIARLIAAIIFARPADGGGCDPFHTLAPIERRKARAPRWALTAAVGTLLQFLPTSAWSVAGSVIESQRTPVRRLSSAGPA